MKKLAVLMTCHNRREKTLSCLESLFSQTELENIVLSVFLVDDGCSDGTEQAVLSAYPDVNVIKGNGELYWNRGMYLAWQHAKSKDYDYYLWLNDDTQLFPYALRQLIIASIDNNDKDCICGSTCDAQKTQWTYGGWINGTPAMPNGKPQSCELCNGNILLVPRSVYQQIGMLDPYFHHALGDYDYSRTAKKHGIGMMVAPEYLGECEIHPKPVPWTDSTIPFKRRLKNLYSPLGNAQPQYYYYYIRKHEGIMKAIKAVLIIHIRLLFPKLWNRQ